jgi:hypothetical protein
VHRWHLDRTSHRINDDHKLHQHAVAGGLVDAALVLADLRIDELAAQRLEAGSMIPVGLATNCSRSAKLSLAPHAA